MGIAGLLPDISPLSILLTSLFVARTATEIIGDNKLRQGGAGLIAGVEYLTMMLAQPQLGIVPIKTTSFKVSRTADNAKTLVLSESGSQKSYRTDSSAPHPREWNIEGVIDLIMPLVEGRINFKPSLIMQSKYIDNRMMARIPTAFRTPEQEIVDVLIDNFTISHDPKHTNAYNISIKLSEFEFNDIGVVAGPSSLAGATGAAAKTLPKVNMVKLLVPAMALGVGTTALGYVVRTNFKLPKKTYEEIKPFQAIPLTSIEASGPDAPLFVGEKNSTKIAFKPYNATNKRVEYTSTNPSVATVNAVGNVTTLAPGSTNIVAKSVKQPEIESVYSLFVVAKDNPSGTSGNGGVHEDKEIGVRSLSFQKKNLLLQPLQEVNNPAVVQPKNATNSDVEYSIDNPTIATINGQGKITTINLGTTFARATCKDNAETFSDFCQVIVSQTGHKGETDAQLSTELSFAIEMGDQGMGLYQTYNENHIPPYPTFGIEDGQLWVDMDAPVPYSLIGLGLYVDE
jgi:uncharacterized protein YjdB